MQDNALTELLRRGITATGPADELLDHRVHVVLRHARGALLEVLAHQAEVRLPELAVEIGVHPVEHLGTGRGVRLAAAHAAPPSVVAPTSPRSRA